MKTVRELLALSGAYLADKGVDGPRLSAERLLCDVLGLARLELYLQADRPLREGELARYRDLVRRRGSGEPLQTIIGTTGFYSREFKVAPGVFIPRPETERLVEAAIGLLSPPDRRLVSPLVVEVGCGSGVIAVSLALEIPAAEVWATDLDARAIDLARHNARRHGVERRVHLCHGELLRPLPDRLRGAVDLLVSNPPYIPHRDLAGLPIEVQHDPPAALDGGPDGLVVLRALAEAAGAWLRPGGWLALEIGADQGESVPALLAAAGLTEVAVGRDYNDLPRVATARRTKGAA